MYLICKFAKGKDNNHFNPDSSEHEVKRIAGTRITRKPKPFVSKESSKINFYFRLKDHLKNTLREKQPAKP